jgi:large subunit ribosomal protein L24e
MVLKRQCSFCAGEIEPGTGTMYVKRDGTVYHFCNSSCRKQQLHLGRVGHRLKWTRAHTLKRAAEASGPAALRAQARADAAAKAAVAAASAPSAPAPKAAAAPAAKSETPAAKAPESAPASEAAEKPAKKPRAKKPKADAPAADAPKDA